jgi:hypothetical protein
MASLNKFKSTHLFNKSHNNKLHGLCLIIIAFNMILELLPHLCIPHIQLSLRSLSPTVNFKQRLNHKDRKDLQCLTKKGTYSISRWVNISLWAWCFNTPSHYKDTGALPNSLAGEEENHPGILKQSLMTAIRELRMDQEHSCYSTILN